MIHARRHSDALPPRVRSDGPPGIDWTHATPVCPACWRQWLAGDLPVRPLTARRTQAALAVATLALSSTAPATVIASEPQHHNDRHAGLRDNNPLDPSVDVGEQEPGDQGDPDPEPPAADPEGPDPGTTPAPEPAAPPAEPAAPDDPVDAGSDPTPQESDEGVTTPAAPAPPPEHGTPPPAAPSVPPNASTATPVAAVSPERLQTPRHTVYEPRSTRSHRSATISAPVRSAVASAPQARTRTVALGTPTSVGTGGRARLRERAHVVRAGESLWSIATDLLGGRAPTARVAAEVQRLWELNRQRIGTGDPDVLLAGTLIRLR